MDWVLYRILIDTETAGTTDAPIVYDIGWVVADKDFNIVKSYQALVSETWHGNADLMKTCYYAEKLPLYYAELANRSLTIEPLITIWREFARDCETYKIREVWAHNAVFDRKALNNTIKLYSNGFCGFFVPYGVQWHCTQALAAETICKLQKYFQFCVENKLLTETGKLPTNAQAVYGFLINDASFQEEHTALSDCIIELKILQEGKRRKHKKATTIPARGAWQRPQKKFQEWLKKFQKSIDKSNESE